MRRSYLPWTSTQHHRFYRACNTPGFRAHILTSMGISETTLKNWLHQSDVPQTKRAMVRAHLEEWESTNRLPPAPGL